MMFEKCRLGRSRPKLGLIAGALFASALAWPTAAAWAQTCSTSICTGSGSSCSISGTHTLTDGCTLNFGSTDVTINSNGKLTVADNSHTYTIQAGSLVVRGELEGGGVTVNVANGFTTEVVSNSPGRIDINGDDLPVPVSQSFVLNAGGAVLIDGKSCDANATSTTPSGSIDITGSSITIAESCTAKGAGGFDGGNVWLVATSGGIDVNDSLEADGGGGGSSGGWISLDAATTVSVTAGILANGASGGDGGAFDVVAGGAVTIDGSVNLNGTGADTTGGDATIDAGTSFSTSTVWQTNAGSEGTGGSIDITAGTSIATTSSNEFRATGGGDAGSISFDAGTTVTLQGSMDTQAGGDSLWAGDIDVVAGGDVTISGRIDADATSGPDSQGGAVTIDSDEDVSISSVVDAGAAGTDSSGGSIDVTANAGVIDISGTLSVDVGSAGWANGSVSLAACEVYISGVVDTRTTGGPDDGTNSIDYNDAFEVDGDLLADNGGGNFARCKCVDLGNDGCDLPLTCEVNPNTALGVVNPSLVVTPTSFPAC